ncbi:MAG: hypothetical protein H0T51_13205 [Pirellulales bacterium]|nr:hypothetical protein [Pirellulales bacterium]
MAIGLGSFDYAAPNRLEIFDVSNVLIDSVVASDAVVTLSSLTPIARMLVTATVASNQAAIDDIKFTVVPEPISASILAPAALAGSWIARRRRRS